MQPATSATLVTAALLLVVAVVNNPAISATPSHSAEAPPVSAVARNPASSMLRGDPVAGGHLYAACMGCHSLNDNDVGPMHRGVVGRAAGAVKGYAYSPALKASGIVWSPEMLDRWLSGPQKLVPGAKMYFTVAKAQDRADIIAYLAQQK